MTKTYLGIDYGTVHVGVAIAEHILATPLPPLHNDEQLIQNLQNLITTHQVTHVVVGLPSGRLVNEIHKFAESLEKAVNLPVTLHDETLSSHEATRQLVAVGASRSKKKNEHSYAAAIILEDYLDSATL